MEAKKLYTRQEFSELLNESAAAMALDKDLQRDALDVLVRADVHRWVHQTSWLGEPILNLPQDMFAIQEIIFKTRPQYVLEIGVAWGGAMLFYATLLEVLDGKKVIGVDIFLPDDLRRRLMTHGRISERLELVEGSSIEPDTVAKVKYLLNGCRDVLVILDSSHSHDHVLEELNNYGPMIGKGHYLVCGDTIIEDIPVQGHRHRLWGPGSNPKTALRAYLQETDRFEVDSDLENKLLFSCNPEGYLKCIRD